MVRRTAEEVEQQALFLFAAAFSARCSRSAVVQQQREAFERECKSTSTWQRDAFARWLPADAKAEVCAELRVVRQAFVKELEAAGKISITPARMRRIVHHVGHFVRRATWRGDVVASALRSRPVTKASVAPPRPKDYATIRNKAHDEVRARVERLHGLFRNLSTELRLLTPEHDPLSSDLLSDLQLLLDESKLGQALNGGALIGHPGERMSEVLDDLGGRLQNWAFPRRPLWKSLLDPLLRVYERASGSPEESGSQGDKRSGSLSRFLAVIYEALPEDARHFAGANAGAFVKQAHRPSRKRKDGPGPQAQEDDHE